MQYDLVRTIDAAVEPVSVAQAKAFARIETDDDDTLIASLITAARQYAERVTGRAFLSQTWRLSLACFPLYGWQRRGVVTGDYYDSLYGSSFLPLWRSPEILLPRPQLIGIASVTYLDATGTRQTLEPSQYQMDFDGLPAKLLPAQGSCWPFALWQPGSVQVTFVAGYGPTPVSVPATLQIAIMMLVAHWYENREATILPTSGTGVVTVPLGFAELLDAETFTAFTLES